MGNGSSCRAQTAAPGPHSREQERGWHGTGQAGGHGRDTKGFVGQRKGLRREGGCPEQKQGRGKVSQSGDPCGMGQEERTEGGTSKGVGDTKGHMEVGRVGGLQLRPRGWARGEETAPGGAVFGGRAGRKGAAGLGWSVGSGAGWRAGTMSPHCRGEKGTKRPPRPPLGMGERKRRDPRGLAAFWG